MSRILSKVGHLVYSFKSVNSSFTMQTFKERLVEVIDQAQHFGALGAASTGGGGGDPTQSFREGLDVTERECECLSLPI